MSVFHDTVYFKLVKHILSILSLQMHGTSCRIKSDIHMRKSVTDSVIYKQAKYSKVQKHTAGNITNNRSAKHLSFLI